MNMNEINGLSWGCKNLIKPFSTASQKWFAKKDSSSGKLYRHLHTYMYLLWKEFCKKDIGRTEVKTGSPFLVFTNGDLRWPNKLVLLYKSLPHGSGHLLSDHQFYKVVPYVEKRSSLTNTDTHSRFKKPKLIVTSTPPPSKKARKKKVISTSKKTDNATVTSSSTLECVHHVVESTQYLVNGPL